MRVSVPAFLEMMVLWALAGSQTGVCEQLSSCLHICALLVPGRVTQLYSPISAVMVVFSFAEAEGEGRMGGKRVRPSSFPEKGRSPPWGLRVPFHHTSRLPWRSLGFQESQYSITQLVPTDAGPCSAMELGGLDLSTQNLYNLKCGLLYTLWRLGTFICNPYHIAGRDPISQMRKLRFIEVRSIEQASG